MNATETDAEPRLQGEPTWGAWPLCRRCQIPRQSVCPVCDTAGHQFVLAYQSEDEPSCTLSQPPLVLCGTCDEAFRPSFYRTCVWCGCDHGDGIETVDDTQEVSLSQLVFFLASVAGVVLFYWWFWGRWL